MSDHFNVDLDADAFMRDCMWGFERSWFGRIDVSVWLAAIRGNTGSVQLILDYTDDNRDYSISIDSGRAGIGANILLNNRLTITGKGPISSMKMRLIHDRNMDVRLENLRIVPTNNVTKIAS